MAGIYLHIPFCQRRCLYCDFYSTTRLDLRQRTVDALCRELEQRSDYLQGEAVTTLYLGGGTPSQLSVKQLGQLLECVAKVYGWGELEEVTMEANPDDLTEEYVRDLRTLPIGRISMGVQTFNDPTLRLLNRRHTAGQALEAIGRLRRVGFDNLSIDLIYGLPGETPERWERDLAQAVALGVEHLSAYSLTYEEGTPLHRLLLQRQVTEVSEELSLHFYMRLIEVLEAAGYEQYEISNFCLPGRHSRHNASYWADIPYLGRGPSAHSYDRSSRQWNVASLTRYLEASERGERLFERESLSADTRYNEFVMTRLRTRQGASLAQLEQLFGPERRDYCLRLAAPFVEQGLLQLTADGRLCLTRRGLFTSDAVMSELMYIE